MYKIIIDRKAGKVKTADGVQVYTLETWLWDAACKIRGAIDAPNYKDYILSFILYN